VLVEFIAGDIAKQSVDVIVNAANSSLLGGGGVDGALHAAAGPGLLAECQHVRATLWPDGLPIGDVVDTGAGRLNARWVIHTVGPNANRGQTDPELLASCFRKSLLLADELGAHSIAFPAISTGVYGWSIDDCASTAREVIDTTATNLELVRFVISDEARCNQFERTYFDEF
jgi:O-acetyl-ADP-ribose deacetylase (regulator of RNase III)